MFVTKDVHLVQVNRTITMITWIINYNMDERSNILLSGPKPNSYIPTQSKKIVLTDWKSYIWKTIRVTQKGQKGYPSSHVWHSIVRLSSHMYTQRIQTLNSLKTILTLTSEFGHKNPNRLESNHCWSYYNYITTSIPTKNESYIGVV